MSTNNIQDLYNKDTFIVPVSPSDTQVRLKNVIGTIKHTISPFEVVATYVQGLQIKIKTFTDIHTLYFSSNEEAIEALTLLQFALDQVKNNILGSPNNGVQGLLGLPTDGAYGYLYPSLAGVALGDRVEDAFDKITTFLERLAPNTPPNLSTIPLIVQGSYSALQAGTGVQHDDITTSIVTTISADGFHDGSQGFLTATVNNVIAGAVELTSGNDTGLGDGSLVVTLEEDAYLGSPTEEGYWTILNANIVTVAPHNLSLGENFITLTHSSTGSTYKNVYLDDPAVPSFMSATISSVNSGTYISGVPFLTNLDTVDADFGLVNVISEYYHLTNVGKMTGNTIEETIYQPIVPPSKGTLVNGLINAHILEDSFELNSKFSLHGYASNDVSTVANFTTNINIDSKSDESDRVQSGTGQYPITYGAAYDSTESLMINEELQKYDGSYQFPLSFDYSSSYPIGPNYTGIIGGTFNNMRWVTFQPISITNEVAINVEFINALNFGSDSIVSGIEIYVKVEGETGWLNVNSAYPGVGTPVSDGDASLDLGESTSTFKRITFSVIRTGDVYVRIGIPMGSDKAFETINTTLI